MLLFIFPVLCAAVFLVPRCHAAPPEDIEFPLTAGPVCGQTPFTFTTPDAPIRLTAIALRYPPGTAPAPWRALDVTVDCGRGVGRILPTPLTGQYRMANATHYTLSGPLGPNATTVTLPALALLPAATACGVTVPSLAAGVCVVAVGVYRAVAAQPFPLPIPAPLPATARRLVLASDVSASLGVAGQATTSLAMGIVSAALTPGSMGAVVVSASVPGQTLPFNVTWSVADAVDFAVPVVLGHGYTVSAASAPGNTAGVNFRTVAALCVLAAVRSRAALDLIRRLASGHGHAAVWLGASDRTTESQWAWLADPSVRLVPPSFTAWGPGMPKGGTAEHFLAMDVGTGLWFDSPSDNPTVTGYVCEAPCSSGGTCGNVVVAAPCGAYLAEGTCVAATPHCAWTGTDCCDRLTSCVCPGDVSTGPTHATCRLDSSALTAVDIIIRFCNAPANAAACRTLVSMCASIPVATIANWVLFSSCTGPVRSVCFDPALPCVVTPAPPPPTPAPPITPSPQPRVFVATVTMRSPTKFDFAALRSGTAEILLALPPPALWRTNITIDEIRIGISSVTPNFFGFQTNQEALLPASSVRTLDGGATLGVTLGPAPKYRPERDDVVRVHPTTDWTQNADNLLGADFSVTITAEVFAVDREAGTGLTTTGAIAGVTGLAAVSGLQTFVLLGGLSCSRGQIDRVVEDSEWILTGPVRLQIGTGKTSKQRGVVIGQLALMAGLVVLHLFVTLFVMCVAGKQWTIAAELVWFPFIPMYVALLLLQGLTQAIFVVIFQDEQAAWILVGLMTAFGYNVLFVGGCVYYVLRMIEAEYIIYRVKRNTFWKKYFLPKGTWLPEGPVDRYGVLFDAFIPEQKEFISYTLVYFVFLAATASYRPPSIDACEAQYSIILAIMAVYLGFLLYHRPYRFRFQNVTAPFVLLCQICLVAMMLMRSHNENPNHWSVRGAEVVTYIMLACTIIGNSVYAFSMLYEKCVLRHALMLEMKMNEEDHDLDNHDLDEEEDDDDDSLKRSRLPQFRATSLRDIQSCIAIVRNLPEDATLVADYLKSSVPDIIGMVRKQGSEWHVTFASPDLAAEAVAVLQGRVMVDGDREHILEAALLLDTLRPDPSLTSTMGALNNKLRSFMQSDQGTSSSFRNVEMTDRINKPELGSSTHATFKKPSKKKRTVTVWKPECTILVRGPRGALAMSPPVAFTEMAGSYGVVINVALAEGCEKDGSRTARVIFATPYSAQKLIKAINSGEVVNQGSNKGHRSRMTAELSNVRRDASLKRQGVVPPLPLASAGSVADLPPRIVQHTVRPGESVAQIAQRYGASPDAVRAANPSRSLPTSNDASLPASVSTVGVPMPTAAAGPPPAPGLTLVVKGLPAWAEEDFVHESCASFGPVASVERRGPDAVVVFTDRAVCERAAAALDKRMLYDGTVITAAVQTPEEALAAMAPKPMPAFPTTASSLRRASDAASTHRCVMFSVPDNAARDRIGPPLTDEKVYVSVTEGHVPSLVGRRVAKVYFPTPEAAARYAETIAATTGAVVAVDDIATRSCVLDTSSNSTTPDEVRRVCGAFGRVLDVNVMRGRAVVEFSAASEAKLAIQSLHGRQWTATAVGADICGTVVVDVPVAEAVAAVAMLHHLPTTVTDREVRAFCERCGPVLRVVMADVEGEDLLGPVSERSATVYFADAASARAACAVIPTQKKAFGFRVRAEVPRGVPPDTTAEEVTSWIRDDKDGVRRRSVVTVERRGSEGTVPTEGAVIRATRPDSESLPPTVFAMVPGVLGDVRQDWALRSALRRCGRVVSTSQMDGGPPPMILVAMGSAAEAVRVTSEIPGARLMHTVSVPALAATAIPSRDGGAVAELIKKADPGSHTSVAPDGTVTALVPDDGLRKVLGAIGPRAQTGDASAAVELTPPAVPRPPPDKNCTVLLEGVPTAMNGVDVAGLLKPYGEVVGVTAASRIGKAFVRMDSAESARYATMAFNASERGRAQGIRAALPEKPDALTVQEAAGVISGLYTGPGGGVTARPTIWHEEQWRERRERTSDI